jgi:hypothetical protein
VAEGQLIVGGLAPRPDVGVAAPCGIVGGPAEFRKARGAAPPVVTTPEVIAVRGDLD